MKQSRGKSLPRLPAKTGYLQLCFSAVFWHQKAKSESVLPKIWGGAYIRLLSLIVSFGQQLCGCHEWSLILESEQVFRYSEQVYGYTQKGNSS